MAYLGNMTDPRQQQQQFTTQSNSNGIAASKRPVTNVLKDSNINISNIIHGEKEQGAKQYQEDSTCMFYSPDLSVLMGAIFDGHGGLNGQVASTTIAKLCKRFFETHWMQFHGWSNDFWKVTMENFFLDVHQKVRAGFVEVENNRRRASKMATVNTLDNKGVVRKASGLPVHGGSTTTIVTALRTKDNKWRVICANVGDSDCLLLARKPARLPGNHKCTHLSVDHSPDSAQEYLRIKALPTDEYPTKLLFVYDQANVCRKFECPEVFLEDGVKDPKFVKNPWANNLRPTNVRYDPAVYAVSPYGVSHDITCIAMTRSLGDFYAHQFGLSSKPDVTFRELDYNHEFIITAGSDGIWDCWKWDDFSDYFNGVMTKHNCKLDSVVKIVLRHTIARAKACFGEGSFDDASLVCIALRPSLYPTAERIGFNKAKTSNSESNTTEMKTDTYNTNPTQSQSTSKNIAATANQTQQQSTNSSISSSSNSKDADNNMNSAASK